jgi:hypothetical protein
MPGTLRKLKRGPRHAVRALHFATAVLFSRRAKAGWVLFCHGQLAGVRRHIDMWHDLNRLR